jgi:thioredoxin-related protein
MNGFKPWQYRYGIFSLIILCVCGSFYAKEAVTAVAQEEIHWLTLEEAMQMARIHKKKVIVDFYTGWCGWCKIMDKRTYQDPQVVSYINRHYYAVKFDAERKDTVRYQGTLFQFQPAKRMHQLAAVLLQDKATYPATVFISADAEAFPPIWGYIDPETMLKILKYYGEDHYLKTPWAEYNKQNKDAGN